MVSDTGRNITHLQGWLWIGLLTGCLSVAQAVENLQFYTESVTGEGWALDGLEVGLVVTGDKTASATASVASLQIAGLGLEKAELRCPVVQLGDRNAWSCADGSVEVAGSLLGAVGGSLSWQYFDANRWQLKLKEIRFSRARLQLALVLASNRLQIDFNLQDFSLLLLEKYFPSGWTLAGNTNIQGSLTVENMALVSMKIGASLDGFSYSSEDGLQVGEDLSLRLDMDALAVKGEWQGKLVARIHQGQLYSDPFFVEVDEKTPLELRLQGGLDVNGERLLVQELSVDYGSVLSVQGDLDLNLSAPQMAKLNLAFQVADLGQAYEVLLQPLVIGNALDDLDVGGQAQGRVSIGENSMRAFSVMLQQMHVEQNSGLFGLSGVEADINWRRSGALQTSRLHWDRGHLYQIAFGDLDAAFSAHAGNIVLRPVSLPVLDGQLQLEDFELGGLLDGKPDWQARADLKDIRLAALSRALGWPELDGSLQATIPRLHYRDATLRMDGELLVDVFGGQLVVEGLKLEDALGVAPVLETSVRLHNLDLEQITQVFDFGRIQGGLEGYIRNLQLVAWQVTGFDAVLQSPQKDHRRHRISQRAIDNLTELGNGASVNLSATMLRFFEDFAYEQLALKIRLRGAVAELDGVTNPAGGYYIVKGAGLPRIDVIGRNHKVAWKDLLSRIRDIRFDDMIVE
ncbi:hypothetical protein [Thiolapillus sp.]